MSYIGKEIRRQPLVITGSDSSTFLKVEQKDSGSTAIFTNNVQNGYPTSNNWKTNLDGSFFNNFISILIYLPICFLDIKKRILINIDKFQ